MFEGIYMFSWTLHRFGFKFQWNVIEKNDMFRIQVEVKHSNYVFKLGRNLMNFIFLGNLAQPLILDLTIENNLGDVDQRGGSILHPYIAFSI